MGSIAGLWIVAVIGISGDVHSVLAPVLITGTLVMCPAGYALDRIRISFIVWAAVLLATAVVLSWTALADYPSMARALAKNGSLQAYMLPPINLGMYAATLLVGAGTWLGRRAP